MADTVTRDIHFYRVDIGLEPSGKPKVFNPTPVFEYIDKLGWKDEKRENRYFDKDGKVLGCWIYSTKMPCKITLGSIRRVDLPQIETQGELSPLEIPEKSGLVEQTHIVFFDDNIVGCDYNFYGPRIARLPFYLSGKALKIAPEYIFFQPILKRNVYEQFLKFSYLTVLQLRIRASYADNVARVDQNLAAALMSAYKAGDTDDVELILRASSNSHGWLAERLLEALKALSKRPEIRDEANKFIVSGYSSEKQSLVELNLLTDKLIISREILKLDPRSRALHPRAAFDAIISAYNEVKDEIQVSPSLVV